MSQIQKLIEKFFEKPVRNDITIEEAQRFAESMGCIVDRGGKHSMHIVHKNSGTVIPIPIHGKNIKEAYVSQLKNLYIRINGCSGGKG